MPTLTAAAGPDAGRVFPLTHPITVVGRHSANAVCLSDERVSRRHFELRADPAGCRLTDLGSGNGTLVNGEAVSAADLSPGDRVQAGDTVLVYAADVPPPALVIRPTLDYSSAVVRTVAAEAGVELLRRPDQAATDWLRGRLASLTALYEAATAVSQILDVDEMLGKIMELVLRTTDADHGVAMLRDPDTGELVPKGVRGRRAGGVGEFVVSRTIIDHVLADGHGVLVADAAADDRFRGGESVARHHLREVICVPMAGRHGTVGALFLDTTGAGGSRFTDDHLMLAVALAHQAALAVEETRYYEALVQAERLAAVGQAMAAMSHHVKNIMQGVRFGGDLIRLGMADDDRELLAKGWKLVERNQGRIDDLILDMLSYSKEREPGYDPADLNALAADVIDTVRGRAADAGAKVTLVRGDVPAVPCDADGLHRALLNVVSNALDAVDGCDIRRVTVTVRLAGEWAEVEVADTGPGVDPVRADDLFKPFVSTKGAKGTGLGLPVSRKILLEHGGDLTVSSADGGGGVFTLRLPAGGAAAL